MSTPEAIQFFGAPIMMYVTILHAPMYTVEVPGRMLSRLNMWTPSNDYNFDLACVIFGFSVDLKYTPPMASCLLDISSVRELESEPLDPEWQKVCEDWRHYIKDKYSGYA